MDIDKQFVRKDGLIMKVKL